MGKKKYSINATGTTGGSLSIGLGFDENDFTDEEKVLALAKVTAALVEKLMNRGYIKLYSSSDISRRYGNSRQYWEKMFANGKIPYQKTASGRVTTNLWVEGYLDQARRDSYPKQVLEMRRRIIDNEKSSNRSKTVECVNCGVEFSYNYNGGAHINGRCKCSLRVDTVA